jgi:2'-5' RNA ligase
LRCFVALQVEDTARQALEPWLTEARERFRDLSVTPPENLHLTLAFLGELDESGVEAARAATIGAAASTQSGWRLQWGGTGAFPSLRRPRVLWMGVDDAEGRFAAVHAALRSELVERGLPVEERRFHPHLTLGRFRRPASGARLAEIIAWLEAAPAPATARVSGLVLYQSKLGRPYAVHTPVLTVDFRSTG